jgi:hypothetical protein
MRGHHLVLQAPSPINPDLFTHDLEAQHLHPGAKDDFGRVSEPGRLSELDGIDFRDLDWTAIASLPQNLRPSRDRRTGLMVYPVVRSRVFTRIGVFLRRDDKNPCSLMRESWNKNMDEREIDPKPERHEMQ